MAKVNPTIDVFISYDHQDAKFSEELARVLRSYDLKVFTAPEILGGKHIEEAIWEAMAESQALVAVVPKADASARTAFELGAAKAWNKPIYAIASDPTAARLPAGLKGMAIYSPSRIDEIAQEIKRSTGSLSDADRAVLIEEYLRIGVPVDQLVLQPALLSRLTRQFKRRARRDIASEEIVRTLLRLRKKGALRSADTKKRPKTA
jgi:nucleoside 2-deoxyribosyltransferase